MADNNNKTNKNEGNKDHVLLSTSLSYKINDDDNDNNSTTNNSGIKCLGSTKFNANDILVQDVETKNPIVCNNTKLERIDANIINESANVVNGPNRFAFLNSYQRSTVDYSNETIAPSYSGYSGDTSYVDWQLNGQSYNYNSNAVNANGQYAPSNTFQTTYSTNANSCTMGNQQNQQLVNYSDFVSNHQAYSYQTVNNGAGFNSSLNSNPGFVSAHGYQNQSLNGNVDSSGSCFGVGNTGLPQSSKNIVSRPNTNDDLYKNALQGTYFF